MSQLLSNQKVAMRDGIQLATDVYLPDNWTLGGKLPVILERTPYDKTVQSRSEINRDGHELNRSEIAQVFNDIGIIVIYQDCRGRYASEGVFTKYLNEAEDGYDTLIWLGEQSWFNGDVGTMGLSYAAHTQLAVACMNPPYLKTMVLDSGGFHNAYQCGIRQGGAFELKQLTWAFKQAQNSPQAKASSIINEALQAQNIHDWFAKTPWLKGHSPVSSVPEYENYLLEQWQHGNFDEFWKKIGIYALGYFDQIPDIPVLCMSSWYDAYVSSTLDNYKALHSEKTAEQELIMGPWLHGDRNTAYSGDVDFGERAFFDGNVAPTWLDYRVQWFKRHLLGEQQAKQSPVKIFVMGGGSGNKNTEGRLEHGGVWLNDNQWPPSGTKPEIWYCSKNMQLIDEVPSPAELRFIADPNHPVPTIGGSITSGKPVYTGGAFDQRERPDFFGTDGTNQPLAARQDILCFQSEPLENDILVAGEIEVKVWLASNAPDCDITVKLLDVYPPSNDYPEGFAMNLTDGIMRARYRNSWESPELMTGEPVCLTVKPFATANLFKKGHRIRLDIAGSNFPHFDCNPNSGEPEGQARVKRIAENRIFVGGDKATQICLQVKRYVTQ